LDVLFFAIALVVALSIPLGLLYWACRAESDRSARFGLYLLFGLPGSLLVVAGAALAVAGRNYAGVLLGVGLGMSLPLVGRLRRQLASVTPIDARSAVDMAASAVFFGVFGFLIASTWSSPEPDEVAEISYGELIVQLLFFIGVSYVVVGAGLRRRLSEANARLGVVWPSPKTIAIAVVAFFGALLVNGVSGVLTETFQPEASDQIESGLEELTGVPTAILVAVSAGVGEELFFRGALQPKFGIILTSLCFALLHANYGLSFVTAGIFSMGVIFGLLRQRYGTTAPMITHGLVNLVAVLAQTYVSD
jgi:membrane protease YdiL (CAAX protease family)